MNQDITDQDFMIPELDDQDPNNPGIAQSLNQEGLVVTFHPQRVRNEFQSKAQNEPVYDNVDFVKILIPGNTKDLIDRPVQDADKERFPREWFNYVNRHEQQMAGTKLEDWGYLNDDRVGSFKALNVFTVEQLIHIPDVHLFRFGPDIRDIQGKAREFIANKAAGPTDTELQLIAQNEQLQQENAQLNERFDRLEQMMLDMQGDKKQPGTTSKSGSTTKKGQSARKSGTTGKSAAKKTETAQKTEPPEAQSQQDPQTGSAE